nr:RNA-directed DNA polymerase, eukaryota, reverse transcriptase zinc-binding domain protein [Tanacetum cinerariifolium]
MIFKVDFKKAFDYVIWDYLDDVLESFGFGVKWSSWISGCLVSSMGSVLINGSPTPEFHFYKGLKQGDPISSFLFILVMKSLHLSFTRVLESGLFKATLMGCSTFEPPFHYLGVKVGAPMSRKKSRKDFISKISSRLSKWKLKTLSIGGRLTLLKSVLTVIPIFYMSLYKVPVGILNKMEAIRRDFFNEKGAIDTDISSIKGSVWLDLLRDVFSLKQKGTDLLAAIKRKLRNEDNSFLE